MTLDEKTKLVATIATNIITHSDMFFQSDAMINSSIDFALMIVNKAEEKTHLPQQNQRVDLNEGDK